MLRRVAPLVAAAVVALAACGSGGGTKPASGTHPPTAPTMTAPTTSTSKTSAPTGAAPTPAAPTTAAPPTGPQPTVTAVPPGSEPAPIATAPPAPHPAPAVVTANDNGGVVHVVRGQQVDVTLSSGELWSEPVSTVDAVLHRVSGSADATTGDAAATFSAVAPGTAKVTSDHRCLPKPGQACPQYIALWSVTVTVR